MVADLHEVQRILEKILSAVSDEDNAVHVVMALATAISLHEDGNLTDAKRKKSWMILMGAARSVKHFIDFMETQGENSHD